MSRETHPIIGQHTVPRLAFLLCPRCLRTVPRQVGGEGHCLHDGTPLLDGCPACGVPIVAPYTHFCSHCGRAFLLTPP